MNRQFFIQQLDKATTKATSLVIKQPFPIAITKNKVIVGDLCIIKNKFGSYDILTKNYTKLYSSVYLFEVAVILAQSYIMDDMSMIKKVLMLQEQLEKHHIDMIHYLHCMKSAKKRRDIERMMILEDKFQVAESYARGIKDKISSIKIQKSKMAYRMINTKNRT